MGSNPTGTSFVHTTDGPVAQWIARLTSNQAVAGSSPARVAFWRPVRPGRVAGRGRARPRFAHRAWGISSIGRVRALQARGTGIETRILHPFAHEQWQVGRVVKAVDSKSTGLRPRQFESGTCRFHLFAALA